MRINQQKIDKIIEEVLNEEIEKKSSLMVEKVKKGFSDGRKKIDVAEPKGRITKADFEKLRSEKKVHNKKTKSDVGEQETEEGNAFSGALANARKEGKKEFEVDGKKYDVKESKVCPKCGMKNCKCNHKKNLKLSESELIDLIESIILEQEKVKDNIKKTQPKGLRETEKSQSKSKSVNNKSVQDTTKKMKEYLKDGSKGTYEESPKSFPKANGKLDDQKKKSYTPSEAVEEYIENFAHAAGLENLQYDEIKPKDEWIDDNIKGSSKTGNNPEWANAEKTDLGEKIIKKKDKNLYGQEKRKGSYKRVTQPIDQAGEHDGEKKLDKMFSKLESTNEKEKTKLNEELNKMKKLYKYTEKTQ